MLLLTKIGDEVKREAKVEEQRQKVREEAHRKVKWAFTDNLGYLRESFCQFWYFKVWIIKSGLNSRGQLLMEKPSLVWTWTSRTALKWDQSPERAQWLKLDLVVTIYSSSCWTAKWNLSLTIFLVLYSLWLQKSQNSNEGALQVAIIFEICVLHFQWQTAIKFLNVKYIFLIF